MAHASVVSAVQTRVADNFSHCTAYVENALTQTPDDNSAFLLIQFPYCSTTWREIEGQGGSVFQEEGAFRFVLAVQRGEGADTARSWLADLATLFRGVQFDGVQTFAPDSAVADDNNAKDSYYRLSIAVPYWYSYLG